MSISSHTKKKRNPTAKGFTLIELSIVLVIIGLVVGGVLVGRDLIKSSEIQAQLSQIEKFKTATHTFKLKYGGLPGDLLTSEARAVGFYSFNWVSPTYGDGNGIISLNINNYLTVEQYLFWRHLSEAKLITGSYGSNLDAFGYPAVVPTTHAMISAYFPDGVIGKGTSIHVGSSGSSTHYFALSGINEFGGSPYNFYFDNSTSPITAQEAYMMDAKIDDGLPLTGSVLADNTPHNTTPMPGFISTPLSANCVASSAYALNIGSVPACSLQFKAW